MKIALFGYGKMGKTIERLATEKRHEIVLKIDEHSKEFDISQADVAIDFSIPTAAVNNISLCLENNVPIVSGTTGWLEHYPKMARLCETKKGGFIYASNFSLGVNIFFELNEQLAKMMNSLSQYSISLEEIHHTQKLDAPSGTAITLAEGVIKNSDKTNYTLAQAKTNEIPIVAKRIENVAGTHTVTYSSEVDSLSINHTANNREGFALGAIVAAEWIIGKKGVFTMKDVLNIG